jgi:hypothetical protein
VTYSKNIADAIALDRQRAKCAHEYIAYQLPHQLKPPSDQWGVAVAPPVPESQKPKVDDVVAELDKLAHDNYTDRSWLDAQPNDAYMNLKLAGCADDESAIITFREARADPSYPTWLNAFSWRFLVCLAITLAITLAVYGLVRAIGWVIGGFAAS